MKSKKVCLCYKTPSRLGPGGTNKHCTIIGAPNAAVLMQLIGISRCWHSGFDTGSNINLD
jgi:hypothetical protein